MSLSLKKNARSDDAEKIEQRLRNRLADLEGRLEDRSELRQLRDHIQHLERKHEIELEKARLAGREQVQAVKQQASEIVGKAKKRLKGERARYERLVSDLSQLEAALAELETRRVALKDAGLDAQLAPHAPNTGAEEDVREFIRQLTAQAKDVTDRIGRVHGAIGDGELSTPTTDVAILEDRTQELLTNPEVRSKALTVAEKARMFANDPGKSQYYRELVQPYAQAIAKVVEQEQHANIVHGARQALTIVEEAFLDSRTYLLRRSGALDDHAIEAQVVHERLEESADDAVDRLSSALDSARALGPVDFFQNMTTELNRRIERGEDGAGVAAWILSDVTVAVLEDETVRRWMAGQS